ncbi:MAG TPA: DNA-3-methyladenine glycosylase [Bacteroidales bacterium]|nr:DNA-3-methyladenine glycosylase [Bacteroidales bacterium]
MQIPRNFKKNALTLKKPFFRQDVLDLAPALLGKLIVIDDGNQQRSFRITETEAYRGEEDMACHARKGRTKRTDPMYHTGGILYIYLIYGMHWMTNVVAGEANEPQAALIRSLDTVEGPGRTSKALGIDKGFNYKKLFDSDRIALLDDGLIPTYESLPRVGIDYAGDHWKNIPWRFKLNPSQLTDQ